MSTLMMRVCAFLMLLGAAVLGHAQNVTFGGVQTTAPASGLNLPAGVAVNGRIAIEQRRAGKDARTRLRVSPRETGHQCRGDDLIPGAADRSDAGGKIQRQHLVA